MTSAEHKRRSIKLLKDMLEFYDSVSDYTEVYFRSDDIIESFNRAIFYLGSSVCPSECLCVNDIRDWVLEVEENG